MADPEYNEIAENLLAEKDISEFSDLYDIINGRYYFVHGEQETEPKAGFGNAKRKAPMRNIRLSNTRTPRKRTGGDRWEKPPMAGDVVDPADDDTDTAAVETPSGGFGLQALLKSVREETPSSDGDDSADKEFGNPVDLANEAGAPLYGPMRAMNRDLGKIYDLLDEGAPDDDPQINELMNKIMKNMGNLAKGGSKARGNPTKHEKEVKATAAP